MMERNGKLMKAREVLVILRLFLSRWISVSIGLSSLSTGSFLENQLWNISRKEVDDCKGEV